MASAPTVFGSVPPPGPKGATAEYTPAGPDWLPAGVPARLGRYALVRPLSEGGIGIVFEARHQFLEQRVAVKVLHPRLAGDPHFAARFRREMAAFGRVPDHPNLIRAPYAGEDNGVLYLVMEFADGADLGRVLGRYGRLPVPAACAAVLQALAGLEATHRAGLVHRDLKPANLMLTPEGVVKILDLGLARLRVPDGSRDDLTPSEVLMGTFDYQAPEQAADARAVDIRADIYSLGCTLYKLACGGVPFPNRSAVAQKLLAHATAPFPPLGPDAPPGLAAVVARMTAKNPADRYPTPAEAAAALAPFADPAGLVGLTEADAATAAWPGSAPDTPGPSGPTPATGHPADANTPPPRLPPPRPRGKRRRLTALALAAVVTAPGGYFATRPAAPTAVVAAPEPPRADTPRPAADPNPPDPRPPADIRPIGTPARDLDALTQLYIFHDLLDRPPVEAVWNPAGGRATRSFDPDRKLLRIDSRHEALFHLGRLRKAAFAFEIQIEQGTWSCGTGVYLGCRPSADPALPGLVFQYLRFAEREDKFGKRFPTFARGRARVATRGERSVSDTTGVVAEDLASAPRQIAVIRVEVENSRLAQVLVNGQVMGKLVEREYNDQFTPADYGGDLGVMCYSTDAVFHAARIAVQSDR